MTPFITSDDVSLLFVFLSGSMISTEDEDWDYMRYYILYHECNTNNVWQLWLLINYYMLILGAATTEDWKENWKLFTVSPLCLWWALFKSSWSYVIQSILFYECLSSSSFLLHNVTYRPLRVQSLSTSSSLGDRIHRNINAVQRTPAKLDSNFMSKWYSKQMLVFCCYNMLSLIHPVLAFFG